MASSKYPVVFVDVPAEIMELSKRYPAVICNLRPDQRYDLVEKERLNSVERYLDTIFLTQKCIDFLKNIENGTEKRVIILFQGYGEEKIGTAVVDIESIYWSEGYPKLIFDHPNTVKKVYGCPNFWGAFILAIASAPGIEKQDKKGHKLFTRTVRNIEKAK